MKILVLNTGSTSLKYDVYQVAHVPDERRIAGGELERLDSSDPGALDHAIGSVLDQLGDQARELGAIGHRVVHGGKLVQPAVIDDGVEAAIEACSDFAPLHNPLNLRGIRAARKRFAELPHVAVFDTAFHASMPERAYLYGLPYELYEQHAIRRYGFHGPSHRYMTERATAYLRAQGVAARRLITCHLGGGASVAAILDGASIDTSMGLTPLEGLVMGTRPGDLDPAIPGLLARRGYSPAQLDELFNHQSGLAGLSGLGGDFRDLAAAAARGHARAKLAIDVFVHRIQRYVGAYAAELAGCDALIFTAGIGEGSPEVRADVCRPLGFLGLAIDAARNAGARAHETDGLADISASGAQARVLVVHTEEERMIARDVYACVTTSMR